MTDAFLRSLLFELMTLVTTHGSRSSQVKDFIQAHRQVPEFVELAVVVIFAVEAAGS